MDNSKLYDDYTIMSTVSGNVNVSVYNLIRSAMEIKCGQTFQNHLDCAFEEFISHGRVQGYVRQYAIDLLNGKEIYIIEGEDTAVIFA